MTTNIGIKALDPNYQKNYVLLVGDSKGTWDDEGSERSSNNVKKIHLNKGRDFMFAYAGMTYNFKREYKSILKSKKVIESQDLIKIFSKIKEQGFWKNTYICAQSKNGKLSLSSLFGNFLVEVEYLCNGSGSEFIQESMNEIWNKSKWMNGKKIIVCPWEEIVPFCFEVLQEASGKDKDKYTGEHMDLGIMTSRGGLIYRNFESLRDKDTRKLKRNLERKEKNIERLFN